MTQSTRNFSVRTLIPQTFDGKELINAAVKPGKAQIIVSDFTYVNLANRSLHSVKC
jgi:hypothetical protein